MMARCNHLLVTQLLANVASISALGASSSALCFLHHPLSSLQKYHRHLRAASPSAADLHRLPTVSRHHHFGLKKSRAAACRTQCRIYSVDTSRNSYGSDDGNDIVSSVRDSLRYDIIQPHLDEVLAYSSKKETNDGNSNDDPTMVLILAVSGGCDSIALFHSVLALIKPERIHKNDNDEAETTKRCQNNTHLWINLGIDNAKLKGGSFTVPCELHVAHFNHEQRGESSDGDEDFVKKLCIENSIPFHSYSWSEGDFSVGERSTSTISTTAMTNEDYFDHNSNETTDQNGSNQESFTQDVARKWRRGKLKELLSNIVLSPNATAKSNSDGRWGAILTAHHRDDADETILLKLLRGSHLTNLRSMDARSEGFDLLRSMHNTDSSSPQSSSNIGYFAKPMLNVRKQPVIEYLTSSAFQWREDESNSSNKYKRNKVRNELMPLLSEIAGGDRALQKRFSNLEQQSRDMSRDLTNRSQDYLQSMPPNSPFLLPKTSGTQFDLVHEEALHSWIKNVTDRELQVSYDQMLRIRDQIHKYPDRLQWTLDVGSYWKLRRNGDTLTVFKGQGESQPATSADGSSDKALSWAIIAGSVPDTSSSVSGDLNVSGMHELCFGPLPKSAEHSTLEIKPVKDCGTTKFTPPWRKGRSAIKIKEFLRGQKVPLHQRDEAIFLCLSNDSSKHALAVYLEGTDDAAGRWIVNENFCPQDDLPVTRVVLGKTSQHS